MNTSAPQQQLMDVPVWAVVALHNNRTEFRDADTRLLADQIRQSGLINPPHYRRMRDGRYEIIDGERRTRAMRDVLEWPTIRAWVVEEADCPDDAVIIQMIAENENRVAINPMDQAHGWQYAMGRLGCDAPALAARCGINAQLVKDRVALLTLNADAQDLIARGTLKPEYGLILAKAELPAMYQSRALDLLRDNPSPNLVWWRATVSEIKSLADQPDMFADVTNWGHYAATKRADVQEDLPLPWTHSAPSVPGEDARTTLVRQITFWTRASEQWQARGKKQHMQACGGAAWQLHAVLQRMDAGTLPGLATY